MYRRKYRNQVELKPGFRLPPNGELLRGNRWEKAADVIPWDIIDEEYAKSFGKEGNPAYSSRLAFGSLYIKERMSWSDEETVEQIRENPYLQMFLGFTDFRYDRPFDPSLMVHFRKRFGKEFITRINADIIKAEEHKHDDDDDGSGGKASGSDENINEKTENKGKLILDATCTPADIKYPKDVDLLNDCKVCTDKVIDKLYETIAGTVTKPRTDRVEARKRYLRFIKSKKPRRPQIRKAIREQLRYVRRNLKSIRTLVENGADAAVLTSREWKDVRVSHEVLRQQELMYASKEHRVPDRIVSLSQPHVRAIIRGKARTNVEFGAKINLSVVNGFTNIEHLSWDAFNEGNEFIDSVERYHDRYGYYPEAILADKIYRTRENLRFSKLHGIRLSGPPLGRPSFEEIRTLSSKRLEHKDNSERNEIEGKFGLGKRKYGLDLIMSKLAYTSESEISMQFLVMNVERIMNLFFAYLFTLINSMFTPKKLICYQM